ncbi:MoxR family ATPase [Oscillospiraceae bacterium OttesenSCG-928-F05]|nr:MoxR family ATPase [Oscillospiraceae bacterium OttesenSCG-928-F05]
MDFRSVGIKMTRLADAVASVIVGRRETIEYVVVALFAGGHVLLEDVPGTGKTVLAKTLARAVGGKFSRIQATPDLLPSDITGLSVFNQRTGEFEFVRGPAFANILLVDEINRATPRTQSALLESMEEGQITEGGVTYALEDPFFVIATQNPIETQGTFPLPEAQLDRFLMQLSMGKTDEAEAMEILDRFIGGSPLEQVEPCLEAAEIATDRAVIAAVHVSPPVRQYIAALTQATRAGKDVLLGASNRGMLRLLRAAQALAVLRGRSYVLPDDIKALFLPVYRHRVIFSGAAGFLTADAEARVGELLRSVPAPTEDAGSFEAPE